MAAGRDMQLTRQVGEYLAAAELGRRGWIATTFTGSLPGFDILAINPDGRVLEVQVKAIRSSSWQLNAGQFLEVEFKEGVQFVHAFVIAGQAGSEIKAKSVHVHFEHPIPQAVHHQLKGARI